MIERETVTPLGLEEIAVKRKVLTELFKEPASDLNYFQIVSEDHPTFIAGGESMSISGHFNFAELLVASHQEKVKVRLDGWRQAQTEQLFEKVAAFGKKDCQKVILERVPTLAELASMIAEVTGSEDEVVKQLKMYEKDRQAAHFGPKAKKPQYLLTREGQLVAYDDKFGGYILLKHTTNDPEVLESIEQIEKYCHSYPNRPVKAVLIGALSARTRGKLASGANHIVVTNFSKNEAGEIDFESFLPPTQSALTLELAKVGVTETAIRAVVAGELVTGLIKIEDDSLTDNKKPKESLIWQNYAPVRGGYGLVGTETENSKPVLGGLNGALSLGKLANFETIEEEEELWQLAYSFLQLVLVTFNAKSKTTKNFGVEKMTKVRRIIGNIPATVGKTTEKAAIVYSKLANLVNFKVNFTKKTEKIASFAEFKQRQLKAQAARISQPTTQALPAAA